jgi:hypothetical protein
MNPPEIDSFVNFSLRPFSSVARDAHSVQMQRG